MIELDDDIFPSSESGYGIIWLSDDPTYLSAEQLEKRLNKQPSFVKYNNLVYYIDNNGKPTKTEHLGDALNQLLTIQDSYINLSAAQMIACDADYQLAK